MQTGTSSNRLQSPYLPLLVVLLAVAAKQRHEMRWRAVATREVANVVERAMALPWEETTDGQLAKLELPVSRRDALPDATLTFELTNVDAPRPAKRLRAAIQYRNTAGTMVDPIALVAWKFEPGGSE